MREEYIVLDENDCVLTDPPLCGVTILHPTKPKAAAAAVAYTLTRPGCQIKVFKLEQINIAPVNRGMFPQKETKDV